MNTTFPLFRIAVAAAAVLFTVLVVHAVLGGIFFRSAANMMTGLR